MIHWKTEQYAKEIAKKYHTQKFDCVFQDCPRYKNCAFVPSQAQLLGNSKAKLFFITDQATEEEAVLGAPAIHPAGKLLREGMIAHVLLKKPVPYLITKTFRAYLPDAKPRVFEQKLCLNHLHKEVAYHKPQLGVALGLGVFQALYNEATNKAKLPPKEEHSLQKLRGKVFDFEFENGISLRVLVTHAPGSVLMTPALYRLFREDAQQIADFFNPNAAAVPKMVFEVKKIENLKTALEVFDYLDFLRIGLKTPTVVAFDTETMNLNRRFNNKFLTWQFSHEAGHGVVFPIEHRERPLFADPELKKILVQKMNALVNSTSAQTKIKYFIGHNIKFDLGVLWGLMGILPRDPRVNIPWWCTMLAAHWLDENRKALRGFLAGSPYSLKTFGIEFFNFFFEEEALERRGDGALEELTLDQIFTYGGTDSVLTRAICEYQVKILSKQEPNGGQEGLKRFIEHYYFPASRALAVMESNGLYVKPDQLSYLQGEDSPVWSRMEQIEKEIQILPEVLEYRKLYKDKIGGKVKNASNFEADLWGAPTEAEDLPLLNLNKADQQKYFYLDFLKLTPLRFSKKTKEATLNSKFLEHYGQSTVYKETPRIREQFFARYGKPIDEGTGVYAENPLLLEGEYRKLKKLGSAYLDGIESYIRDPNGDCLDSRVRANFNIHGTDTGRISGSSPNLQQLPSGRTKVAKEVKNMFQAEPPSERYPNGTILIQGDYKTAEVRWAALFANDPNLISIFQESAKVIEEALLNDEISDEEFEAANLRADLHRRTASLMFGVPADKVSKAMRQNSKSITFGLLFGMQVKTLCENNGWSLEEGEEKLAKYFSAFPKLEKWLKNIANVARRQGYVETFMGRRRRLKHLLELGDKADSWKHQTDGERKAMNSSIQGQSSDAGTIGMFTFMQHIFDHNLEDRWLIQNVVHDSCLVQVPFEDIRSVLPIMKQCFVKDMQSYIEHHWNCKLVIPIEMEFEIGLGYGSLKAWDGRKKSLDALLEALEKEKSTMWKKSEGPRKPPKALDLVTWSEVK